MALLMKGLFIFLTVNTVHGGFLRASLPIEHHRRQAEGDQADGQTVLNCLPSCELSSCGSGCTSTKRAESDVHLWQSNDLDANGTVGHLAKRQWRLGAGGTLNLAGPPPWEIDPINQYMQAQTIYPGNNDPHYGTLQGFYRSDESAVSQSNTFGNTAFQFGTGHLRGCTMVTVVSKRAVWMAHFWESYTNGKPNQVSTSNRYGMQAFRERMTYFLVPNAKFEADKQNADPGYYIEAYGTPATKNHPYLEPFGKMLDNSNFNQPGDTPRIFIMSPAADDQDSKTKKRTFKYANRMATVETALKQYIANGVTIFKYAYIRADAATLGTNQRGTCLFQFDPDADGTGTGKKQWRLFYENTYWFDNVP